MPKKKDNRAKELEELKKMLLDDRQRIIDHLFHIEGESEVGVADMSGDSVDVASVEISQNSLSRLGSRERKLLSKIDHALQKFEDGTYGICELTGEEIPTARLRARPVAQYTIEAKEMLERKEKQFTDNDDLDGSSDGDDF
ncbi:MAG: TraR/DksA family transcriptional regulator [bacterium]|nr:TraR/DksA family transcriptional regulator [bacterium]